MRIHVGKEKKHTISPYIFMQFAEPVGEVMRLFRSHIGRYALDIDREIGQVDLTASLSEDEKILYVHAVNTDRLTDKRLEFCIDGQAIRKIRAFTIAKDAMTEITYQNPNVFQPTESETAGNSFVLPASGVSALEIELA